MNIIGWVVLGGIAGWLASIVMKRNSQMGLVANVIVGVVGAAIGGWLVTQFGGAGVTGFNLSSLLVAILGAVVLLAVINVFAGRRRA
ncbi:MAG TPA: GlsB/YeaQ/YmgE family stress response membrane protein [Anaerolineales bacterium]|jgi:uncharacterized membrane protein YeaQ/YmgE (transglycosylase-associated protein family)|nr:GlsB/YeaQ/YmgE family stress response membrane protein [Anaerolineales bacterium]